MSRPRSAPRHLPLLVVWLAAGAGTVQRTRAQAPLVDVSGLRLFVDERNAAPTLRIVRPGRPAGDRAIVVLFPEHVTAVLHGEREARQLYRWEPDARGEAPRWRRTGQTLEYARALPGGVRLTARATLDSDGVRLRYVFDNMSASAYDMIYAVTDPRLTADLHDVRLERTYVHRPSGLALLAEEMPERLTLPLEQWLPARYLASFTWPVPARRVERRADGIAYHNASRRVDAPFIATTSSDGAWVVASFARTAGNVWSNPELTCQHVDPQVALGPAASATTETKLLVLRGSVGDAFEHMRRQRDSLR